MAISQGEKIRRQVMGDEFVEQALAKSDEFTEPMQHYINDHGWGSTWQRGGIDLKTRSLITIAMLAALKAPTELTGHIRGALRNGASKEEIQEVLLHSAVYCGAPAAQEAFRAAKTFFDTNSGN
jgi:4-carboxymuconolactone decarboxylase